MIKLKEIIIDTILDTVKLIPFLFIAFLIIEIIEHKFTKKEKLIVEKSGKYGPLLGSILGIFPQCGFSVLATNLYVTRIISLGTLISIYLSTSDEMLPILISRNAKFSLILTILSLKFLIGMISGFIIDYLTRNKKNNKNDYHICKEDNCHCENGIIKSSIKHTINIILFIALVNFSLTTCFEYLGSNYISKLFLKDNIASSFISSLVGLIPNCGSSVMITELYLSNTITFGSMLAGLLTGSGVAIFVLFKTNKNIKENMKVVTIIYLIGSLSGLITDLIIKLL